MLAFNPSKRCAVEEALAHPYLEEVRDIDCEVTADKIFSFDFEKWRLSKESYQELFYQEICFFHPEAAAQLDKSANNQQAIPDPSVPWNQVPDTLYNPGPGNQFVYFILKT